MVFPISKHGFVILILPLSLNFPKCDLENKQAVNFFLDVLLSPENEVHFNFKYKILSDDAFLV